MNHPLRDYQQRDVERLRAEFRKHRAVLYQLSTGGGKTHVFSYITESSARRGNRIWILVHRQELIRQSSASLTDLGVNHGIISPHFTPDPLSSVQIASVQTLVKRLDKVLSPDLIVVDESHHCIKATTWGKILTRFPDAKILGVTATPCRLSGEGLGVQAGGFFETMVNGPPLSELIRRGYLSPPKIFAPSVGADLNNLHKRYGEYIQAEVTAAMDKPVITGCAIQHYRNICHNQPAIAFCASVAHAEHVADQFRAAGYRAASIDGTMHDHERKGRLAALGNGGLNLLTSCDLVSEGFDLPVVSAAILLRPTASLSMLLQQVGRALRTHPGKQCAYILDHVNNISRHKLHGLGHPEWDIDWSLDGEVKRKKGTSDTGPAFRQCPDCYCCHPPAPTCPECGHAYASGGRDIEQVDGELREVDVSIELLKRRQAEREKHDAKVSRLREDYSCKTYQDCLALVRRRGQADGYAFYIWQRVKRKRGHELPMVGEG